MAAPQFASQGLGFAWIVLLGLIGAWIGLKLKIPAGVLVGSMAAVGLGNVLSQTWGSLALPPLPSWAGLALQLALGITLGAQFSLDTLGAVQNLWKPILLSTTFALGTGVISAYGLSRWLGIEQMTALLSTAPGSISGMSLLAQDMGAQSSIVVVMHLARLITVVVFVPLLVKLLVHQPPIG